MIFDTLQNLPQYSILSPNIEKAIQFILNNDLNILPEGKHLIDGDRVFVPISNYQTKMETECVTESHKKYIDIQIMLKGCERMGVAFLDQQEVTEPYNEAKDYVFYKAALHYLTVCQHQFIMFFPTDLHSPCHRLDQAEWVKKAVVKLQI